MQRYNPSQNKTLSFFIDRLLYFRNCLEEEKKKPFWSIGKRNNIGFWHGCIVQTKELASYFLSWEEYQKVRDS